MAPMLRNVNDIGLEIKRLRLARATDAAYQILGSDPRVISAPTCA